MKRLGFILFVMLLLPSFAKAEYRKGKEAEQIILKGKIIAENWDTGTHHVRVIYKGQLWGCKSEEYRASQDDRYLFTICTAPR